MSTNRIPVSHGQEIEQHGSSGLPRELVHEWGSDHGGISETCLDPSKQVKRVICSFNDEMVRRFGDKPWNWHAANGSTGCGSHAHIQVTPSDEESAVEEWTIAWNTSVTLAPVFAPFFRFDWENGFREGSEYSFSELNVRHWADAQTTRYARDTVRSFVEGRSRPSREYSSVTMNPPNRYGGKPLTIEFRMNENHPAFAMTGLHFLKRVIKWCIEEGWSPKLENSRSTINQMYDCIYETRDLVTAMENSGPIVFQVGRGIPGIDQVEFDSMKDLLLEILKLQGTGTGSYDQRVKKLVRGALKSREPHHATDWSPHNNLRAMWHVCDDEFEWDNGPEVK